ncbi:MAG: GNAT family N-acetyltransferase [Chitinophagaceae bacterium]
MPFEIETPRLLIRTLQLSDEAGMFEMDSDPEVHRFLGNKFYKTSAESRANIELVRQQYLDNGIGRWAVIEKETGEFVGWTGFKLMREKVNGYINYYDFGYRQKRSMWRKGYGYEAGHAALEYGLEKLGLRDVFAMTQTGNAASRRLLEKLGFQFVELFAYDSFPSWHEGAAPTIWYAYPHKKE